MHVIPRCSPGRATAYPTDELVAEHLHKIVIHCINFATINSLVPNINEESTGGF